MKKENTMDGATVTINIPVPAWERLVQAANKQQRPAQELLIRLIQDFTRSEGNVTEAGFYSKLTRRYLQGTLKRTGSINAFRLSPKVAAAIQAACKASDAVNLIEQARDR
jgi:hypothetical protein